MFLAIRDDFVAERSDNIESLLKLDQSIHEVVEWNQPLPPWDPDSGEPMHDPRSPAQKINDLRGRYKRRRRQAYPPVHQMLLLIYGDMKNGTTEFVDAIDNIHGQFPKPE